jgi:hypothetical protein
MPQELGRLSVWKIGLILLVDLDQFLMQRFLLLLVGFAGRSWSGRLNILVLVEKVNLYLQIGVQRIQNLNQA